MATKKKPQPSRTSRELLRTLKQANARAAARGHTLPKDKK